MHGAAAQAKSRADHRAGPLDIALVGVVRVAAQRANLGVRRQGDGGSGVRLLQLVAASEGHHQRQLADLVVGLAAARQILKIVGKIVAYRNRGQPHVGVP
eukprot:3299468-Pyramimonas_sp.AAC.1